MCLDPVCGATLDSRSPHKCTYGGQTYAFCCPTCKTKFAKEPRRYTAPAAGSSLDIWPSAARHVHHYLLTAQIGHFMHSISTKVMSKGTISWRRAFK